MAAMVACSFSLSFACVRGGAWWCVLVVMMGRAMDRRFKSDGQILVKPRLLKFNFEIEIILGIDDTVLGETDQITSTWQ